MLKKKIFVLILLCFGLTAFGKYEKIAENGQIEDVIRLTHDEYYDIIDDKLDYHLNPVREQIGERHAALWNTFENITELRGEYPGFIKAGLASESFRIILTPEERKLLDAKYKKEWKGTKIEEYGLLVYEESKEGKYIFEDKQKIYEKEDKSTSGQIFKIEAEYKYNLHHGKYKEYHHVINKNTHYNTIKETFVDKKGEYFNGFMNGIWETKDKAGNVEKQEYLNGRKHGKYINEKNQVFEYVNGFKHGKWIETENGVTKEILYEYGKPIQEKIIKGAK